MKGDCTFVPLLGRFAWRGTGPGRVSDAPRSDTEDAAERRSAEAGAAHRRRGWIRRLYDWVLHWADTPTARRRSSLLALAESSFFPIPPDPLLIALCLGAARRSFRFAASATVASVVGGMVGYAIGAGAWQPWRGWFFAYVPGVTPAAFARVQGLYARYDFWAVFLPASRRSPTRCSPCRAGVFAINFGVFVVASVLSRGLRFFVIAGLIYRFGPPIARFIDATSTSWRGLRRPSGRGVRRHQAALRLFLQSS